MFTVTKGVNSNERRKNKNNPRVGRGNFTHHVMMISTAPFFPKGEEGQGREKKVKNSPGQGMEHSSFITERPWHV